MNAVHDSVSQQTKEKIEPHFSVKKMPTFITIKPPLGCHARYERISYWSDHLRKVSATFIITRESNKTRPGYHFHAVATMKKKPPKSWFKKNFHFHLTKIGSRRDKKQIPIIPEPPLEVPMPTDLDEVLELLPKIEEFEERQKIQLNRRRKQISAVLDYCLKESPGLPFTDYVCVYRNKVI